MAPRKINRSESENEQLIGIDGKADFKLIILTKLSGKQVMINEQLIETAYETPDTVVMMNNGHTYIVTESVKEIMDKIAEFRRSTKRRLPVRMKDANG